METELLKKRFNKMGAGVKAVVSPVSEYNNAFTIDVKKGVFEIAGEENIDIRVVDMDVKDRHLLLHVSEPDRKNKKVLKHKFLLGHDERDWFVAAVPEVFHWVKTVREAKQALKPEDVLKAESVLPASKKDKRRNKARVRQGEWFFVPVTNLVVDEKLIHKNEPLSRGRGSKPHMVDEIFRAGGTMVYVSRQEPAGISEEEYMEIISENPADKIYYRAMVKDALVYARGCVRHADHATIWLDGWHRVFMNTEALADSRKNLAFLD